MTFDYERANRHLDTMLRMDECDVFSGALTDHPSAPAFASAFGQLLAQADSQGMASTTALLLATGAVGAMAGLAAEPGEPAAADVADKMGDLLAKVLKWAIFDAMKFDATPNGE